MIFIGKCVNKISIKNPSACVKQMTYVDVMLLVHPTIYGSTKMDILPYRNRPNRVYIEHTAMQHNYIMKRKALVLMF